MDLPLFTLVLLSACGGPVWTAPNYCQGTCPHFTVVEKYQGFEERLYAPAKWITTALGGSAFSDFMAARSRLANVATYADSWPVLMTVTNDSDLSYSWFVPSDQNEPEITDPSVILRSRPEVTAYVRFYEGTPSIESGQHNAKILYDDLKKGEKTGADSNVYMWAGYGNFMSIIKHNEIWIEKTQ